MVRYVALVGFTAVVVGLWALYALSSDYRVFGGVSTGNVLLWAAWIATALLLVLTLGRIVVAVAVALLDRDTTGLQRGIIYAVVAFVVISAILAVLGTNPTTLLATSFIATAIIGLATQSTIGGLVAGSTLQLDRALHVGDLLLVNQEPIEVMSMSWRSVVGRKHDGAVATIPNARIADGQIDVIRADQPARIEVMLTAALSETPHRVAQALIEAAHALPGFDPGHQVHFDPTEYRAGEGSVAYRLGFWVRRPHDIVRARAILLSRIWYVFQREDIPWLGQPGQSRPPRLVQLPNPRRFAGSASASSAPLTAQASARSCLRMVSMRSCSAAPSRRAGRCFVMRTANTLRVRAACRPIRCSCWSKVKPRKSAARLGKPTDRARRGSPRSPAAASRASASPHTSPARSAPMRRSPFARPRHSTHGPPRSSARWRLKSTTSRRARLSCATCWSTTMQAIGKG
jgi:small-conductance mechanosensitive channel